jgi:hypothetical protein
MGDEVSAGVFWELNAEEIRQVSGGGMSAARGLWAASLPARGVIGAWSLGWVVGSAIYRTYDKEIQAGIAWAVE